MNKILLWISFVMELLLGVYFLYTLVTGSTFTLDYGFGFFLGGLLTWAVSEVFLVIVPAVVLWKAIRK